MAATTIEQYNDILQEIKTAQAIDELAANVKHRIVGTPIVDIPDLQITDELEEEWSNEWKVTAGVLPYEERIYVPKDDLLRNKVISLFHDNPESSHLGALKTAEFSFIGFPLARHGRHHIKIHCRMRTMPLNQGTTTRPLQHKHATSTTITALGRSDHGLRDGPP